MTLEDFDELDGAGKATVYIPRSATRAFSSPDALRKWVLSMVERGHYIRSMRITRGDVVIFDGAGTSAPATESVASRGEARRGGRPRKAPSKKPSKAETRREKARERQRRYREGKATP